ncbi:MAG: hypothetical protein V4569_05145 [Pseudomonadota bacterium]
MVAEVAVARQPDAPVDHDQVAAEATEVQSLSGGEALKGPVRLRIHHQSPVFGMAIIGLQARRIQ